MNHSPLTISLREAGRITGLSNTSLYRALGEGKLQAIKFGKKTLIRTSDLEAFIAGLPAGEYRGGGE